MERQTAGIQIKIKSLSLERFRKFNVLPDLSFNDNITVIISENGGGKTTILDAVANALQVFVYQLTKASFTKPKVQEFRDIKNGLNDAYVELKIEAHKRFSDSMLEQDLSDEDEYLPNSGNFEYDTVPLLENVISLIINKHKYESKINGFVADEHSVFSFGDYYINEFREGDFLPVLIYYGCNSIDTQQTTERKLFENELYHIYADSLSSRRFSFDSFLRWSDHIYKKQFFGQHKSREWEVIAKVATFIMNDEGEDVFTNLRMDYRLESDMLVLDKKGENGDITTIAVDQLSSGEKVMFAITMDIAKRLIIANPDLLKSNQYSPLEGGGIVLIDEIDLHLHPKWQRVILPKLLQLFPNIQFVVTTHSPFVVQSVSPQNCLIFRNGVFEISSEEYHGDYEDTVRDSFDVQHVFDYVTTKSLSELDEYIREVLQGKRDTKDIEFVNKIKQLSRNGDTVKAHIAFKLSQMENKLNNGKN